MSENLSQLLFYNAGGDLEYLCNRKTPSNIQPEQYEDIASKPDWSISKLIYDGVPNLIRTSFANDSASFNKVANDREYYQYTETLTTYLTALSDILAGTTYDITNSSPSYAKTGDNGDVGASATIFNNSDYMKVYIDDVELVKGTEVTWASSITITIVQAVLAGQVIKILS